MRARWAVPLVLLGVVVNGCSSSSPPPGEKPREDTSRASSPTAPPRTTNAPAQPKAPPKGTTPAPSRPATPRRSPAEEHLEQGAALNAKGDYAGAADCFRRALAADPRSAAAAYSLGVALQNARRFGEAGDAYEQAIRIDRSLALAHAHLGECRLAQEDRVSAQRAFEEATRLGPELPTPWIGLATMQVREGRAEVAVRTLIQGARLAGESPELQYHLALAYEANRDLAKARATYEKAIEIDPRHGMALNNLGVLVEGTDIDRAIGLWERAVAATPDLVEARKNLGVALHKKKQRSYLAIEHLERALALGCKDARLPGWISEAKEESRTFRTDDRALAVFDRFDAGQVFVADGAYPVRDAAVADRARPLVKRGDRVRLVFESPHSPKVAAVELQQKPR